MTLSRTVSFCKSLSMSSCSLGGFKVLRKIRCRRKYGTCVEGLCVRRSWTRYGVLPVARVLLYRFDFQTGIVRFRRDFGFFFAYRNPGLDCGPRMVEYRSNLADPPGKELRNMKRMKDQQGKCRKQSCHGNLRLPRTVKFQVGHLPIG